VLSDWRLFTGITGLLGQYLLCNALQRREHTSVLVRGRRGISASDRVDQLLSVWEKRLGKVLPRPVVLEGDLRTDNLALSKAADKWFRQNVKSVVHSAASVLFQESPNGEPMKSNAEGTRHLLDFCRDSSVREFHYVSSAYSCGRVDHAKRVLEELHAEQGPFGNIYERSKCLAEHNVARAEGEFTRTIYRPSVIIGESESGYSPSFNAIYTPLRLAWLLLHQSTFKIPSERDFLQQVGSQGTEARNLVPVDWVSKAIASIVREPSCHGGVYHITNPVPTEGRDIVSAMVQAVSVDGPIIPGSDTPAIANEAINLEGFGEHMEAYKSYLQSDPTFDNSRFRAAAVCPPCPAVGKEALLRAFSFAVRARFENHDVSAGIPRETEPRRSLEKLSASSDPFSKKLAANGETRSSAHGDSNRPDSSFDDCNCSFRLTLSGSGGGIWQISTEAGEIRVGLPASNPDDGPQFYATAAAFRRWLDVGFSLEDGIRSGQFVMTGTPEDLMRVSLLILNLQSKLCALKQPEPGSFGSARTPPVKSPMTIALGRKSQ
jgi:nucleoside-diphosphate-sugar epimerase